MTVMSINRRRQALRAKSHRVSYPCPPAPNLRASDVGRCRTGPLMACRVDARQNAITVDRNCPCVCGGNGRCDRGTSRWSLWVGHGRGGTAPERALVATLFGRDVKAAADRHGVGHLRTRHRKVDGRSGWASGSTSSGPAATENRLATNGLQPTVLVTYSRRRVREAGLDTGHSAATLRNMLSVRRIVIGQTDALGHPQRTWPHAAPTRAASRVLG